MPVLGSTLNFSANLYDKDPAYGGVLVNATTVALAITLPDGTSAATPSVTNPPAVTGKYVYDLTPSTQEGDHVGLWTFTMATGRIVKYTETIPVTAVNPKWILSLPAAKKHLNISLDNTDDDSEIIDWLSGMTPMIEEMVGACVPRTVVDYAEGGGYVLRTGTSPVLSVTSIGPYLTAGTSYTAGMVKVSTDGRIQRLTGLAFPFGPYEITYVAGRRPIPANIVQASKLILAHLWETQRGPVRLPLQGGVDTTVVPGFGYAIPNRALELLRADDMGPSVG